MCFTRETSCRLTTPRGVCRFFRFRCANVLRLIWFLRTRLILLPWYNGEYERKATERATIGLSGSRLSWGDGSGGFYSLNMAFRYYPNGNAFRGFYLGPRVGVFWVSQEEDDIGTDEDRGPHLGLGFELGYAWLVGSERHLSISIGGGATRVFNGGPIPVLRLVNIGWAF